MSIYDLEFDGFIVDVLVPDKRGSNTVTFIQDVFAPIQEDHDALFQSYRLGSTAGAYSALNAYNLGDQVVFRKSVYESTINNNATDPTNTQNWVLMQDNFIGILERIEYTSQKIVLEYALNKWFGTNFQQPPGRSDIYISDGELIKSGFRVGLTEPVSSTVGTETSSAFVGNPTPFSKLFGFAIFIPAEVYAALDPEPANRDSIVRSFANLYVLAGVTYQIQTY